MFGVVYFILFFVFLLPLNTIAGLNKNAPRTPKKILTHDYFLKGDANDNPRFWLLSATNQEENVLEIVSVVQFLKVTASTILISFSALSVVSKTGDILAPQGLAADTTHH